MLPLCSRRIVCCVAALSLDNAATRASAEKNDATVTGKPVLDALLARTENARLDAAFVGEQRDVDVLVGQAPAKWDEDPDGDQLNGDCVERSAGLVYLPRELSPFTWSYSKRTVNRWGAGWIRQ